MSCSARQAVPGAGAPGGSMPHPTSVHAGYSAQHNIGLCSCVQAIRALANLPYQAGPPPSG